jgi:D-sedoheptulose 7-phosphate isomerase
MKSENMTRESALRLIEETINTSISVKQQVLEQSELIAEVAGKVTAAFRQGHRLLLFGNGGSAGDAQHIAAELVGRFYLERRALPAEALTVNTSALTALANDYAYELIFARQVEALGNPGDVAIGISTSGNSPNVVEGLRMAKKIGMLTIGLTGAGGGKMKTECDYCLCVPSKDTPRIQESHILLGHIICDLIEKNLFATD